MPEVSALTIARGRDAHLANVVHGLSAQTQKPCELVVAVMQDMPYRQLPKTEFPVRQIHVTRPDGELPLAAARNAAAANASGEVLAFVDVDCIPDPGYIADVARVCRPGAGLFMGEVAYLPRHALEDGIDFTRFARLGVRHSDRHDRPGKPVAPCNDYRCFWSLNFALSVSDWIDSGGFHEEYYGYGGEDTDFGRTLEERGIPINWMQGAKVYHQYHDHCMPPIHHLHSVLRNADVFAARWGHRTMGHWLHAFRLMGLIEQDGDQIRVLRQPSQADFAMCHQSEDMPYANSRRVIDQLQNSAATGAERAREVARDEADLTVIAAE